MLSGDNSILQRATDAKIDTEKASIIEQARTDILGQIAENKGENISKEQLATILNNQFKPVDANTIPDEITTTNDLELTTIDEKYKINLSEIYTGLFEKTTYNLDTLTIGTATNTAKYGWTVPEYTTGIDETGGWRLFYQDKDYTYIISDELVGTYTPSDYYSDYANGTDVGLVGQKLNSSISDLFTETNTYNNIRATAWLTDTEYWKDYVGSDAIFAIASPTIELFAASYNSTGKSNTIVLDSSSYGYTYNIAANWLNVSDNYGIYNKEQSSSSSWWLASPGDGWNPYSGGGNHGIIVYGYNSFTQTVELVGGLYVRPLVCIPTSKFNSKYTLIDE